MTVSVSDLAPLSDVQYQQWSEVAQLDARIVLDGIPYPITEASWTENAHGATDTLTVTVVLSTSPDFPVQLFRDSATAVGADELAASQADIVAELWAGFPQNPTVGARDISQLTRVFLGEIDVYTGKIAADTVTFECRSLAARLVDDHITGVSVNETVGQFFTKYAAQNGYPAPTVNVTGRQATIQEVLAYDQIGGARFPAALYGMHPMDLGIRGAQVDDTDFWVDIRSGAIHYESPSLVDRGEKVRLTWGRDWNELEPSHSPQQSKEVEVQTHAVQPRTRTSTSIRFVTNPDGSVTATQSTVRVNSRTIFGTPTTTAYGVRTNADGTTTPVLTTSSSAGGAFNVAASQGRRETAKQRYDLYLGNVEPERAVIIGEAYRRQLSQHEYAIQGEIPITNALLATLRIESMLEITGAPWSLTNQTYYPRSIEHRISSAEGWKARVHALTLRLAGGGV
jgi:hypothetical protein